MLELIIIGAGPAGITAAVYAARKRMSLLVISKDIGGQAAWSGDIENYTGYQFISGPELADKFAEHIGKYGVNLKEQEAVVGLKKSGDIILVKTGKSNYETKTVIIASGKRSRELGVPGEKEFKNKGLTYCATCDGPLFSGKPVAVIGGGNSALDAALQLVNIASKVYLVNITSALSGDEIMRQKVESDQKVELLNDTQVTAITGDRFVKGIKIKRAGREEPLAVEGIFVEVGLLPNSEFATDVEKNKLLEIQVNSRNETNIPGVFAAGDVTDVPEKQIIIAAGEGSKAALSAFRYLAQHKI
ncbi:MAG: FAD-binding protein [Candidatus Omnitrophica bacterium]|nr:FAD-binding protein [Candidatus Omnitrophota bacterium]